MFANPGLSILSNFNGPSLSFSYRSSDVLVLQHHGSLFDSDNHLKLLSVFGHAARASMFLELHASYFQSSL